jgi:DNA-directed RNA polymerase subunit RPC12/RpoP
MAICIECGEDFVPGHKGYANKCEDCSFKRKPTPEQQKLYEQAQNYFVNSEGVEVHFEVIRRFHVTVSMDSLSANALLGEKPLSVCKHFLQSAL